MKRYVGFTEDLRQRLRDHNNGCNPATVMDRPWRIKGYVAFENKGSALALERYLKTGSGHAFAKKRLWQAGQTRDPGLWPPLRGCCGRVSDEVDAS